MTEAIKQIDELYLNLIKQGWTYNDVAEADYYHLLEVLSVKSDVKKKGKRVEMAELANYV